MRMNIGSKKFRGASSEVCWTSLNVRDILKRREYTGVMIMNNRLWNGLDNPRTVWIDESEWKVILDCHEVMVSETDSLRQLRAFHTAPEAHACSVLSLLQIIRE